MNFYLSPNMMSHTTPFPYRSSSMSCNYTEPMNKNRLMPNISVDQTYDVSYCFSKYLYNLDSLHI